MVYLQSSKYEFGRLATGQIVVIDEVHTPDSSRYFPLSEYASFLDGQTEQRPGQLSKEFVREWLVDQGFSGEPGQEPPHMSDDFILRITARYIDLYERMLGHSFDASSAKSGAAKQESIRENIVHSLGNLSIA